jgi:hypothetical protein
MSANPEDQAEILEMQAIDEKIAKGILRTIYDPICGGMIVFPAGSKECGPDYQSRN